MKVHKVLSCQRKKEPKNWLAGRVFIRFPLKKFTGMPETLIMHTGITISFKFIKLF